MMVNLLGLMVNLLGLMVKVWWLDSDFHADGTLLDDWERNVLFVDDWTVDWNMYWVWDGLLDDIWDLSDNFNWSWNWNLHGHINSLLDMNWVWSVKDHHGLTKFILV